MLHMSPNTTDTHLKDYTVIKAALTSFISDLISSEDGNDINKSNSPNIHST